MESQSGGQRGQHLEMNGVGKEGHMLCSVGGAQSSGQEEKETERQVGGQIMDSL